MKPLSKEQRKRGMRKVLHLTRPPRLEGKVKEAMMQPKKKPKQPLKKIRAAKKQGYSARERKNYQLRSKKH